MLSGGGFEQRRVCMDGVTVPVEVEGRVDLAFVVIGVRGLREGTRVFFSEGAAVNVIVAEITVASEVV